MSSRAGSTFVTFLMSIPLAAVGLMAVFGVPPLSSVIAASRGLTDSSRDLDAGGRGSRRSSDSQFEEWDAESAPEWSDEGTELTSTDSDRSDRERDDLGFSKFPDDEEEAGTRDSRQGRPKSRRQSLLGKDETGLASRTSTDEASNDAFLEKGSRPTSMKESLKKLNSLGVKHYHLERGADKDTWLFVCLFAPGDDTRVTHRFESESDDPDQAAAETVKQIDSWLLERFRDKQPISQNAL